MANIKQFVLSAVNNDDIKKIVTLPMGPQAKFNFLVKRLSGEGAADFNAYGVVDGNVDETEALDMGGNPLSVVDDDLAIAYTLKGVPDDVPQYTDKILFTVEPDITVEEVQTLEITGDTGDTQHQVTLHLGDFATAAVDAIQTMTLTAGDGPVAEHQHITVVGTAGHWQVDYDGGTKSGDLLYNVAPGDLKTAIEGLANWPSGWTVTVTGGGDGVNPYEITFGGVAYGLDGADIKQINGTDIDLEGDGNGCTNETITPGVVGNHFHMSYQYNGVDWHEGATPVVLHAATGYAHNYASEIKTALLSIADFSGKTADISVVNSIGQQYEIAFTGTLGEQPINALDITSETGTVAHDPIDADYQVGVVPDSFKIAYDGDKAASAIKYTSDVHAAIETALESLTAFDEGDLTVTKTDTTHYVIKTLATGGYDCTELEAFTLEDVVGFTPSLIPVMVDARGGKSTISIGWAGDMTGPLDWDSDEATWEAALGGRAHLLGNPLNCNVTGTPGDSLDIEFIGALEGVNVAAMAAPVVVNSDSGNLTAAMSTEPQGSTNPTRWLVEAVAL